MTKFTVVHNNTTSDCISTLEYYVIKGGGMKVPPHQSVVSETDRDTVGFGNVTGTET